MSLEMRPKRRKLVKQQVSDKGKEIEGLQNRENIVNLRHNVKTIREIRYSSFFVQNAFFLLSD